MRAPARLLESGDFVIQRLPFRVEDVSACDDNIDFMRARLDGAANFGDAFCKRRETGGKSRRDSGHFDAGAVESSEGGFNKRVVDTNRGDLQVQFLDAEALDQFLLDGLSSLRAKPADTLIGVVGGKGGEIHAGDGAQQPRDLPIFLHGAPGSESLRAAFHCACIDADLLNPVEIEKDARICFVQGTRESERLGADRIETAVPGRHKVPFCKIILFAAAARQR